MSACVISPPRPSIERDGYLGALFENGLEAARKGVAHPDLRIIKPLLEDAGAYPLRCWTVIAQTEAGDAFFAEAVIRHPNGTVILSYEAPFIDGAERSFQELFRMVHES